jgi:hypothetical protein
VALTKQYEIPEADQAALVTEPEKVLPRVLAEVHAKAVEHTLRVVQANLPQWLAGMNQQASAQKAATETFFKEWPELNKPEFLPVVARTLSAYRVANPNAKPEEMIREGGVQALVALRQPLPDRVMVRNNAHTVDATKPGATVVSAPASSGPPPAPAQKSDNTFTVIAEDDLQESR